MDSFVFVSIPGVITTQKSDLSDNEFDAPSLVNMAMLNNYLMNHGAPKFIITGTIASEENKRKKISEAYANAGIVVHYSERKYDTAIEIDDWAKKNSVMLDRVPFVFIGSSVHDTIKLFSKTNLVWVRHGYARAGFEKKHLTRSYRKILSQILFLNR